LKERKKEGNDRNNERKDRQKETRDRRRKKVNEMCTQTAR